MAEIFGIAILVIAGGATLAALLITAELLLPGRAQRARQVIELMPGRVFIIGLVNLIFFGVIAALLGQGGEGLGLIALLIMLALLGLAIVGLTGVLLLLRQRIFPNDDPRDSSALGRQVKSSSLLVMALLAPVAGWFILAPILIILGLGAGIISLIRRSPSPPATDSY